MLNSQLIIVSVFVVGVAFVFINNNNNIISIINNISINVVVVSISVIIIVINNNNNNFSSNIFIITFSDVLMLVNVCRSFGFHSPFFFSCHSTGVLPVNGVAGCAAVQKKKKKTKNVTTFLHLHFSTSATVFLFARITCFFLPSPLCVSVGFVWFRPPKRVLNFFYINNNFRFSVTVYSAAVTRRLLLLLLWLLPLLKCFITRSLTLTLANGKTNK